MTKVFSFTEGSIPLLISIPHDGRRLAPGQSARMTAAGRALPDTDWYVRDLYSFASDLRASVIAAEYSRYVVDLNRPATDTAMYANQVSTGLCPARTFAGRDIYRSGESVSVTEQESRVTTYWRPYHDKIRATLENFRQQFGYALLWDAHSIAAEVPLLFSGTLTDLNVGTNGSTSCAADCEEAVMAAAATHDYSSVLNGRFRGGYITRHYGSPKESIHAIQLELSQRCYMDEKQLSYDASLASRIAPVIENMLAAFIASARK